MLKISIFIISLLLQSTLVATETKPQWYRCIVNASSHMAYYTFLINQNPCEVYWKEIDTQVKITECKLPIIAALKPSAQDKYSVVWFNMETGAFYHYLSGVKDRGKCTVTTTPNKNPLKNQL